MGIAGRGRVPTGAVGPVVGPCAGNCTFFSRLGHHLAEFAKHFPVRGYLQSGLCVFTDHHDLVAIGLRRGPGPRHLMVALYRAEVVLLALLLGLLGTCLAAAAYRDQAVHWAALAPAILGCFAMIGIGL
jgi:hypothetical protein